MAAIHSLRPRVAQEEALHRFGTNGWFGLGGLLRGALSGPLRSLADAYVPFHLYRVETGNDGLHESRLLALDAVSGILDPYTFDRVPGAAELVHLETRNSLPPSLPTARSKEIVTERVRREIFRAGFFRIRDLQIRAELIPMEIHLPYWIGFFGSGDRARLAVLDAVRGRMEGAKARAFFESWLTS